MVELFTVTPQRIIFKTNACTSFDFFLLQPEGIWVGCYVSIKKSTAKGGRNVIENAARQSSGDPHWHIGLPHIPSRHPSKQKSQPSRPRLALNAMPHLILGIWKGRMVSAFGFGNKQNIVYGLLCFAISIGLYIYKYDADHILDNGIYVGCQNV